MGRFGRGRLAVRLGRLTFSGQAGSELFCMQGKETDIALGGRRRRWASGLLVAGLAVAIAGCAAKPKPEVSTVKHDGTLNPPVVISGKPARDGRAFMISDEELSEADWKILEKLGPRPIWQQVNDKTRRNRLTGAYPAASVDPSSAVASIDELGHSAATDREAVRHDADSPTGQSARPCRSTRPRRCRDADL